LKESLKIPKVQPEAVILRRTKYNDKKGIPSKLWEPPFFIVTYLKEGD
jgi:hypothetical protein